MSGLAKGILCVNGQVIANACQTATYIAAGLACPDRWKPPTWIDQHTLTCTDDAACNCHQLVDDDGVPFEYSAPDSIVGETATGDPIYEACWYNPAVPCSADFLGLVICSRTVGQDYERDVIGTDCGAILGAESRGPVTVTFEAWIVARTAEGAGYGWRWLNDVLEIGPGGCVDGCAPLSLSFFEHCGCGDDTGLRRLSRSAAVTAVEDITPAGWDKCCGMKVQWTITDESAFLFGDEQTTDPVGFAGSEKQWQVCVPPCVTYGQGPCGEDCVEVTVTESVTVQRPRRECSLTVSGDGATAWATIPEEDSTGCTWTEVFVVPVEECTAMVGDDGSVCLDDPSADPTRCRVVASGVAVGDVEDEDNQTVAAAGYCPKVVEVVWVDQNDPSAGVEKLDAADVIVAGDRVVFRNACVGPLPACPGVVKIWLNNPGDPKAGYQLVADDGSRVDVCDAWTVGLRAPHEGDTVIVCNNPTDDNAPVFITSSYDETLIECGNPCISGHATPAVTLPETCWCRPVLVGRECSTIEGDAQHTSTVGWEIYSGSLPLRNLRIRMWVNHTDGDGYDDDPARWECQEPCSTVQVAYVAPGARLRWVATEGRSEYVCNGGVEPGGQWFTGASGAAHAAATIPPGCTLVVCVEADLANTAADAAVSFDHSPAMLPVPC